MTLKTKLLIGTLSVVTIGAAGILMPLAVSAAETTDPTTTFAQKLAEKLGLSTDTVQTALTSVKTDMQTQRETQMKADIAQAVTDGKLTQRQADILNAIPSAEDGIRSSSSTLTKPDFAGLTDVEIKAKMDEMKAQMDQKLVDALNAAGLNTTLTEVQSAQSAANTAGLRIGFGGKGHGFGGPRMF